LERKSRKGLKTFSRFFQRFWRSVVTVMRPKSRKEVVRGSWLTGKSSKGPGTPRAVRSSPGRGGFRTGRPLDSQRAPSVRGDRAPPQPPRPPAWSPSKTSVLSRCARPPLCRARPLHPQGPRRRGSRLSSLSLAINCRRRPRVFERRVRPGRRRIP